MQGVVGECACNLGIEICLNMVILQTIISDCPYFP
jgi:hypothetical protein